MDRGAWRATVPVELDMTEQLTQQQQEAKRTLWLQEEVGEAEGRTGLLFVFLPGLGTPCQ